MKAHTIHLSDEETAYLKQVAERKGMSKIAVMRQALRMYQLVDERGCTLRSEDQTVIVVVI